MSTWDYSSELDPDRLRDRTPVNFGIEDRPAQWGTEEPDGMCRCGEDAHPGFRCDEIPVASGFTRPELSARLAELTRQRRLLEAQLVELKAQLVELRSELDAERAARQRAEADVVEMTIERDAQERYAQELLRRVEGQVSA